MRTGAILEIRDPNTGDLVKSIHITPRDVFFMDDIGMGKYWCRKRLAFFRGLKKLGVESRNDSFVEKRNVVADSLAYQNCHLS